MRDGRILKATFTTHPCQTVIACADLAATLVTGLWVDQALLLDAQDIIRMLGGLPEGREHCPQLVTEALHKALTVTQAPALPIPGG